MRSSFPPLLIPAIASAALAGAVLLAFCPSYGAGSRLNKNAQALARQLSPSGPARAYRKEDIGALSKRMIAAIQVLEKSYRTSGPTPESLISKALTFRDDLGNWEKMMLTNSLLSAWREANAMGAFDKAGKFHATVSQGRGVGDRTMFELVVPGEALPQASNQLANVRLVREEEKRAPDAKMSPREQATLKQLQKLIDEKASLAERKKWEDQKTNKFGRTEEEELYIWDNEMAKAGDAAKEMPNVRVLGDSRATPSHMTKGRWRTSCEVLNLSTHPTEVKVEVFLIGYTWKKRDHYIMSKTEKVLKLRQNQSTQFDVFTKSEGSYKGKADDHDGLSKQERRESKVYHRGYAIRVTHEKGLVSFTGSDKLLTSYMDPSVEDKSIDRLPTF